MSHSRNYLTPRKHQGRDETFDFLISSPTSRSPKLAERKSQQVSPPIMPTTTTTPPLTPSSHRPISPTFKTPKPLAPPPPFPQPDMPPFETYKAAPSPSRFVSPKDMTPVKNPSKVATTLPPVHDVMLRAGYMAHEFLTKGTLCGQIYDPAQANTPPASLSTRSPTARTMNHHSHGYVDKRQEKVVGPEAEPKLSHGHDDKGKEIFDEPEPKSEPATIMPESQLAKNQRYAEVSELLKNGAHVPGIVNPSQLARFLNL